MMNIISQISTLHSTLMPTDSEAKRDAEMEAIRRDVADRLLDTMLLTTEEATALLRMSVRSLQEEVRLKKISTCRPQTGRIPFFTLAGIKDYIDQKTVPSNATKTAVSRDHDF